MARRTNDLTEFAQPVADELADRIGSLKRVLSAGVLALADLTAEQREYYIAKSVGKDLAVDKENQDQLLTDTVKEIGTRYKIPNKAQQQLITALRKALGPSDAETTLNELIAAAKLHERKSDKKDLRA
jgi:hypothetical protein